MASLIVSLEGKSTRRTNGKPKSVIVGLRRRHAQKTVNQLRVLINQDIKEKERAARYRYSPCLLLGEIGSPRQKAAAKIIQSLVTLLKTKV